jgi:hypothetical protein
MCSACASASACGDVLTYFSGYFPFLCCMRCCLSTPYYDAGKTSPPFFRSLSQGVEQGDQIGRIFARWAVDFFLGHFFENLQKKPAFLGYFFHDYGKV